MYINVKKLPEQTFKIFVFYIRQMESKVSNTTTVYATVEAIYKTGGLNHAI